MIKRILPEELKLGMFIESAVFEKGEKQSADFVDNVLIDSLKKLKKYKEKGVLKYLYIDTDRFVEIKVEDLKPEVEVEKKPPVVEKIEEKHIMTILSRLVRDKLFLNLILLL